MKRKQEIYQYCADTDTEYRIEFEFPSNGELLEMAGAHEETRLMLLAKKLDWYLIASKIFIDKISPARKRINALADEASRVCLHLLLPALYPAYEEALSQIQRIDGLLKLLDAKKSKKFESWESAKAKAKEAKIEDLFAFQKAKHRYGGGFTACCPFHEDKNPSFVVYADNRFRCFGCGVHGDVIAFQQKISGLNFKQAVQSMAGVR